MASAARDSRLAGVGGERLRSDTPGDDVESEITGGNRGAAQGAERAMAEFETLSANTLVDLPRALEEMETAGREWDALARELAACSDRFHLLLRGVGRAERELERPEEDGRHDSKISISGRS